MFKKKKIRQIFISTIVAILFLVPMIANAATVTSGGSTGGSFTTIERYPDGGWRNFIGNINLHRTEDRLCPNNHQPCDEPYHLISTQLITPCDEID